MIPRDQKGRFLKGCPRPGTNGGESNPMYGIKRPEHSLLMSGSGNPRWKGGGRVDNGYIQIWCPNHPRSRRNRVYKHTLIAEKALGRFLKPKELVHHINGVKDDNRDSNLLICDHAYHRWLHRRRKQESTNAIH